MISLSSTFSQFNIPIKSNNKEIATQTEQEAIKFKSLTQDTVTFGQRQTESQDNTFSLRANNMALEILLPSRNDIETTSALISTFLEDGGSIKDITQRVEQKCRELKQDNKAISKIGAARLYKLGEHLITSGNNKSAANDCLISAFKLATGI